jgi:hypothetical protein
MHFKHTLQTTATPESIWAVWTDVKRWPSWDTELEEASLAGPFALGAQGILKSKGAPPSTFTISQLDMGRSYTFTTKLPLAQLHVRRYLNDINSATLFTHEVSFSGSLAFVFARVLGGRFQAALPGVMRNIQRIVETV